MSQSIRKERCKDAVKHWNAMMESLEQVIYEGGTECQQIYELLKKNRDAFQKATTKAYQK